MILSEVHLVCDDCGTLFWADQGTTFINGTVSNTLPASLSTVCLDCAKKKNDTLRPEHRANLTWPELARSKRDQHAA